MNKWQRKKKVYSIIFKHYKRHEAIELRRHGKGMWCRKQCFIEYSNSDEFKKQEYTTLCLDHTKKPHGWCVWLKDMNGVNISKKRKIKNT